MAGMQVFVRTTDGQAPCLELPPTATIGMLKAELEAAGGPPAARQKLSFAGAPLPEDDAELLCDIGISAEAVIDCGDPAPVQFSPWFRTDGNPGAATQLRAFADGSGILRVNSDGKGAAALQPFACADEERVVRFAVGGPNGVTLGIVHAGPLWRVGSGGFNELGSSFSAGATAWHRVEWQLGSGAIAMGGVPRGRVACPPGGVATVRCNPKTLEIVLSAEAQSSTGEDVLAVAKSADGKLGMTWRQGGTVLKEVSLAGAAAECGAARFRGRRVVSVNGSPVATAAEIGAIAAPCTHVSFQFEHSGGAEAIAGGSSTVSGWNLGGPYAIYAALDAQGLCVRLL
eukprot:TRINITY_DN8177_c0_g1_i1.p1 TRINITY_DN8177_c0_g1~~TRINITY_DN8177_c0_g1_i1.p1  ORF type:complete len:376 (+),score=100.86 TRINITY_DN8177_c0_g1_i1:100-1128(+)